MLPDMILSTVVIDADFVGPRNDYKYPLEDAEIGGAALNDSSEGLLLTSWSAYYDNGAIFLQPEGGEAISFLSVAGITEFQFTFDQNMQPTIVYETEAGAFIYWYDSTVEDYTTTPLPAESRSVRCSLDDKRRLQGAISDVVVAYIRGDDLFIRLQRDRYDTEYSLFQAHWMKSRALGYIGLNEKWRFQFQLMVLFPDPGTAELAQGEECDIGGLLNAGELFVPAVEYNAAWSNIGNVLPEISGDDVRLPAGGSSGYNGANAGTVDIDYTFGDKVEIEFDRFYSGNWYDDDFTDGGFIVYAFFNRLHSAIALPGSAWTYRRPHLVNNGGGVAVHFRRTHTLVPRVIAMNDGAYVQQDMTQVNPGNAAEDSEYAAIRMVVKRIAPDTMRVDIYINGVHRWTHDSVYAAYETMTIATGCVVGHFHSYAGNGTTIWTRMDNTLVRVASV